MVRLAITASADADLAKIILHLRQVADDPVARKYAAQFDAVLEPLADFPGSGPRRPMIGPLARITIVPPYIIIYDPTGAAVSILRVVHGKSRITAELLVHPSPSHPRET
jgi:plasmid stabilization system protein ParE